MAEGGRWDMCNLMQDITLGILFILIFFYPNDNSDVCVDGWFWFNDLPSSTDNSSNVIMYADDTSIPISNNRFEDHNGNFNKHPPMVLGQSANIKYGKDHNSKICSIKSFIFSIAYNFCWTVICWNKCYNIFWHSKWSVTFHGRPIQYKLSIT